MLLLNLKAALPFSSNLLLCSLNLVLACSQGRWFLREEWGGKRGGREEEKGKREGDSHQTGHTLPSNFRNL